METVIFSVRVQSQNGSWEFASVFFVAATGSEHARMRLREVYPEFRDRLMIVDGGAGILLMTPGVPVFTKVR